MSPHVCMYVCVCVHAYVLGMYTLNHLMFHILNFHELPLVLSFRANLIWRERTTRKIQKKLFPLKPHWLYPKVSPIST